MVFRIGRSRVQDAEDISIPPGTDRGRTSLPRGKTDPRTMNHHEEFRKDLMNAKLEWHFNFNRSILDNMRVDTYIYIDMTIS